MRNDGLQMDIATVEDWEAAWLPDAGEPAHKPEIRLWTAVLMQAVKDVRYGKLDWARTDAAQWLHSDASTPVFDFLRIDRNAFLALAERLEDRELKAWIDGIGRALRNYSDVLS